MPENFEQPKPLSQRPNDPNSVDLPKSEVNPGDSNASEKNHESEKETQAFLQYLKTRTSSHDPLKFPPNAPELFKNSPEIQHLVEKVIIFNFSYHEERNNTILFQNFDLSDQFKRSEEFVNGLLNSIKYDYRSYLKTDQIIDYVKPIKLPNDVACIIFGRLLSRDYIDKAVIWKNSLDLPKDTLDNLIKEFLAFELSKNGKTGADGLQIDHVFSYIDKLNVSGDIIKSKEVQDAAKKSIFTSIRSGYGLSYNLGQIRIIQSRFGLSEEEFNDVLKNRLQEGFIKKLGGDFNNLSFLMSSAKEYPPEVFLRVIESPEVKEAVKSALVNFFSNINYELTDFCIELKDYFKLPSTLILSSEIQEAVKKKILFILSGVRYDRYGGKHDAHVSLEDYQKIIKIRDEFEFDPSSIRNDLKQIAIKRLSSGKVEIIAVISKFNLLNEFENDEEIKNGVEKGIRSLLVYNKLDEVSLLITKFSVSENIVESIVCENLLNRIKKFYSWGELDNIIKIKSIFNLSNEITHSSGLYNEVTDLMGKAISTTQDFNSVKKLQEEFKVSQEDMTRVVEEQFVKQIKSDNWNLAIKIMKEFGISDDVIQAEGAQILINKGIEKIISTGNFKDAFERMDLFKILVTDLQIESYKIEFNNQAWKQIPQNIENIAKFFNQALASEIKTTGKKEYKIGNIKGLSTEELTDIQKNVDEELGSAKEIVKPNEKLRTYASKLLQFALSELYENKDFETIAKLQNSIGGSAEAISALDQAKANVLTQNDLIKFIPSLGGAEAGEIFPLTFSKAKEMIFAKLATDQDLADYFVENLDKYYQQPWVAENVAKAIQQYSVAQKFIYAVENAQTVWKNEAWVVDILAKAKVIVEEHKKQFPQGDDEQGDSYGYSHGNQGFREFDPFANHPWRFGDRQIRISSAISEMMAGKVNSQELEKLGINSNEISASLAEVNEKVNTAYQNFLEQIRSNTSIKEDDKQAFLDPESSGVKMTPLLDNIRAFIARYFVQSVEGDAIRLSEIGNLSGELDRILAEGFRRYIKIHEVDIPLYDKLYEEFDTLRETGRSPLEVYLGRDGIYAYIGRHSQDVARRRKLGLEGRKKLKEMGEVVEIHPQYTVYPRYFRDNLNQETKRQFLEQEGISPDADPLFYDTGYTGTIPEQIMKVMDFSQEDIEKRIRLLSAPSVHRRVKGIPENARSEIIEYIEHNAKTEETAEGLIIDEKTGKIRHIARPTNPEEQFYFMMVKQAVARHYWLQEQLHHEPSGNVNLDSEHYTIRIRQEYAKLLPPDFMQNPKEFLTQHGEMLKGSKGEGEYPDEEVVLFKMTDGTEIVAKKIELRKAKEARKEFSILISAKKAGLPTAEPVGFLSGKEESDGSYLLMKKIDGISGRNFDKYLRDTGKFTEEKIKSILQQVAQKNKEMAELFRTTLKIDKRWRIKDTIIELNEETGEVESVVPIDWERAQNFNPATPKEIDEIT